MFGTPGNSHKIIVYMSAVIKLRLNPHYHVDWLDLDREVFSVSLEYHMY